MNFEPGFLIIGGVLLLIGGCFFLWARSNIKKVKRIVDTPTTPVRNVQEGFVEVKGKVKCGGTALESPLSKKRCVYYRFHVQEHVQRGKNSYWKTVIDDKQDAGLLVEDASQASIKVNLTKADLILKPDNRARSAMFKDAAPELEATLKERYGRSSQGFIFNKTMQYTETMLEEGDEIYVLGTAVRIGNDVVIDKANDLFIVSDETEEQLTKKFNTRKIVALVFTSIFGLAGVGAASMSVLFRYF
jgi:hypothetical protein